jgi:O-acetylserine/cysteine efflux transporter
MSLRDFLILVAVCSLWACNTIVSKLVVAAGVPPLMFATGRFALIVLVTAPWLRPLPKPLWRVATVGVLMGAGVFGLTFVGLTTATSSSVGVVSQIGAPVMSVLSFFILGERLTLRRVLGSVLAVIGAAVVMWNPAGLRLSTGLMFIVAASLCGAVGAIMMKQALNVRPLQFQAWVGLSSLPVMATASALFEHDQGEVLRRQPLVFAGGVLFTALLVSIVGHTTYYGLLRRYDVNLLAPITLLTPLMVILMGVGLTHDPFGPRMVIGAVCALSGVLIIAVQPGRWFPVSARVRLPAP